MWLTQHGTVETALVEASEEKKGAEVVIVQQLGSLHPDRGLAAVEQPRLLQRDPVLVEKRLDQQVDVARRSGCNVVDVGHQLRRHVLGLKLEAVVG